MSTPVPKFWIVAMAGLWVVLAGVRAEVIPYYRMDSLVLLSDVIVLCDEQEMWFDRVEYKTNASVSTLIRCKAARIFKGGWMPGSEFTVRYNDIYRRNLANDPARGWQGKDGKRAIPRDGLPLGRALLFLKRDDDGGYRVVTAKLIQEGTVLQYGQFESSLTGLSLMRQWPENVTVAEYGEAELIEDLLAAQEKAKLLRKPVGTSAWQAMMDQRERQPSP